MVMVPSKMKMPDNLDSKYFQGFFTAEHELDPQTRQESSSESEAPGVWSAPPKAVASKAMPKAYPPKAMPQAAPETAVKPKAKAAPSMAPTVKSSRQGGNGMKG